MEESEQSVGWPSSPRPTEVICRDVLDHEFGAFEVIRRNFWHTQMWISRTACWVSCTVMPSLTLHHLTNQLKQAFNHYKTYKAFPCLRKSTLNSSWLPSPALSIHSSFIVLSSTHPSLRPVSLVLPLGLCPRHCLDLKCMLSPICLAECSSSGKIQVPFQFHHGSSFIF